MSSKSGVTLNAFSNPGSLPQTCSVLPVVLVTANTTLTTAQSGSLVSVNVTGGNITVTLPPVQQGLNFRIVSSAQSANTMTVSAGAALLSGAGLASGGATPANLNLATAGAKTTIATVASKVGDTVCCLSDGTLWYINFWTTSTANAANFTVA